MPAILSAGKSPAAEPPLIAAQVLQHPLACLACHANAQGELLMLQTSLASSRCTMLACRLSCLGPEVQGRGLKRNSPYREECCYLRGPHEMLACASLLGDLFPAAWPPSGAARPGQGSHAPPAHRRYRAALAKSFEPSTQEALRSLMACAAASESLIFRAALVRLCARASGTLLRRNGAYVSLCWPPRTEVARYI